MLVLDEGGLRRGVLGGGMCPVMDVLLCFEAA